MTQFDDKHHRPNSTVCSVLIAEYLNRGKGMCRRKQKKSYIVMTAQTNLHFAVP